MKRSPVLLLTVVASLAACVDPVGPVTRVPARASTVSAAADAAPRTSAAARIEFKLRRGVDARLANGSLRDRSGQPLATIESALARQGAGRVRALIGLPAAQLDALGRTIAARGGPASDVRSWYAVTTPDGVAAERLVAMLQASRDVEDAYLAPVPAPPPAATPNFAGRQDYFGAPPQGTGAAAIRPMPGVSGAGVTVMDLEYGWTYAHEDLQLDPAVHVGGTPYAAFGEDHGTAVLGVLVGRDNGYGVTGGVPASTIRTVAPDLGQGYAPAAAIVLAAASLRAGDVLLLEQQTYGPAGQYVPLEWIGSVYDAVRTATAAGIVVVEPAGNGSADLGDPQFLGRFDGTRASSGAIIVGASDGTYAPLAATSYGARVDVHAPGVGVVTTGYGDIFGGTPTTRYTATFGGTSSAAAIVAATAAGLQGYAKSTTSGVLTPAAVTALLQRTGTPQAAGLNHPIGPLPNLAAAVRSVAPLPAVGPLLSRASGKCLDVLNAAREPGSRLIIYPCHGGANQLFTSPAVGGSGELRVYGTSCLAVSGAGLNGDAVVTAPCIGGAAQQWTRSSAGEFRGLNGRCLDVLGAHTADYTTVWLWDCHGGDNQRWNPPPTVAVGSDDHAATST